MIRIQGIPIVKARLIAAAQKVTPTKARKTADGPSRDREKRQSASTQFAYAGKNEGRLKSISDD